MNVKSVSLTLAMTIALSIPQIAWSSNNLPANSSKACRVSLAGESKTDITDLKEAKENLADTVGKKLIKPQSSSLNKDQSKYKTNLLYRTAWNLILAKKGIKANSLIARTKEDGKASTVPRIFNTEHMMAMTIALSAIKGELKYVNTSKVLASKMFGIRKKIIKENPEATREEIREKVKKAVETEKQSIEAQKSEQQKHIESNIEVLASTPHKMLQELVSNENLVHELNNARKHLSLSDRMKPVPYLGVFFRKSLNLESAADAYSFRSPEPSRLVINDSSLNPLDIFTGKINTDSISIEPYRSLEITQQETQKNTDEILERNKEIKHLLKPINIRDRRAKLEVEYVFALNRLITIYDYLRTVQKTAKENNRNYPELDKVVGVLAHAVNMHPDLKPTYRAKNELLNQLLEVQKAETLSEGFLEELKNNIVDYINVEAGTNLKTDEVIGNAEKFAKNHLGVDFKALSTPKERIGLMMKIRNFIIKTRTVALLSTATIGTGGFTVGSVTYQNHKDAINVVQADKNLTTEGTTLQKVMAGLTEAWANINGETRAALIVKQTIGDNILKDHKQKYLNGFKLVEDYSVKRYASLSEAKLKEKTLELTEAYSREFIKRYEDAKNKDTFKDLTESQNEKIKLKLKMNISKEKKELVRTKTILTTKMDIIRTTGQDIKSMNETEFQEWSEAINTRIEQWVDLLYTKESTSNKEAFVSSLSDIIQNKKPDAYALILENKANLPEHMNQELLDWIQQITRFGKNYENHRLTAEAHDNLSKLSNWLDKIGKDIDSLF